MRYKLTFGLGLATGYVLGSRAGREHYEKIVETYQRLREQPQVQETAALAETKAATFADTMKREAINRFRHFTGGRMAGSRSSTVSSMSGAGGSMGSGGMSADDRYEPARTAPVVDTLDTPVAADGMPYPPSEDH